MSKKNGLTYLGILILIFGLPLWTYANPAPQNDNNNLAYGDNVSNRLDSGDSHVYTFEGAENDVVNISVEGDFSNKLSLYTAEGILLSSQDNISSDVVNTRIGHIILPATATYTIEVKNNDTQTEQYTLYLNGGTYDIIPIQFNQTVEHVLQDMPYNILTFSASAGDNVSIYIEGDFDPFIEFFAPGNQLITATRSAQPQKAEILNVTLENTGLYRLAISYFGNDGGTYSVKLEGLSANYWILENGRQVDAHFVTSDPHQWTFSGSAGEFVTIGTSGDLDTEIILYLGEQYITSDSNLFQHNAYLRDVELPENGIYTVYVWDYTFSHGDYSIFLNKSSEKSINQENHLGYGDAFPAQLTEDIATWTFDGTQGDVITIGTQLSFEANIYLYTPANELLASDYTATYTDPYLEDINLPVTGTYRITIEKDYGTGKFYRIGLLGQTAETNTLIYGDRLEFTATADEQTSQTFKFDAQAGDIVTMIFIGGFNQSFSVYDENGEYMVGDSESLFGVTQVDAWPVTQTGEYTVIINYDFYTGEDATLSDLDVNRYVFKIDEISRIAHALTPGEILEVAKPENDSWEYWAAPIDTHYYQFNGAAGDQIEINVDDFFEPIITLYDSSFKQIPFTESSVDYNVQTLTYDLPATDTYFVSVYQEFGISSYTIQLERRRNIPQETEIVSVPETDTSEVTSTQEANANEISVSDNPLTLSGEITSNDLEQLRIMFEEGQILFLGVKTEGFTPQLNIYYPEDSFFSNPFTVYIPSQANNVGDYDAAFINFNVIETGDYLITANRISPLESGTYEFEILNLTDVATPLQYNTPTESTAISDGKIDHLWYFSGTARDEIQILFEADRTVSYVVYGPYSDALERITSNEATIKFLIGGLDSAMFAIWIPNPPESYTIQIVSDSPEPVFDVAVSPPDSSSVVFDQDLSFPDSSEQEVTATAMPTVPDIELTYNSEIQGTIAVSQSNKLIFDGTAGDVISVEIASDFDSYLDIYNPQGIVVATNDDTNGVDAAIVDFELLETGPYIIQISGVGSASGDYTLTLNSNN